MFARKPRIVKFWYNPNFLAITALIILAIPALKSLAQPGFYTSHDGETHTVRIAAYYQALTDGQIPPRYAGSLYNGLGSPIFVYIYPLPYLLGSIIHAIGFSFTDSFKILMALGFTFSAIFAYLWLREVTKSEKAAFLGALFYTWVPYRFLLIYVRGSISELLAYTFLPLVFYSLTKLAQNKNLKWIALCSISASLLLLSQNLIALITIPVIALYVVLLSFFEKSPKYFLQSIIVGIWAMAISSVTYIPSLFERKFIRLDEIISVAYPDHFVSLKQLIHSPWGYGFDLQGTTSDQMSFQIGLVHFLVFGLSVILLFYLVLKRFSLIKKSQLPLVLFLFFILVFVVSLFLMLVGQPTLFVWQHIKPFSLIDIPWRFLGVSALATSFLAAFVVRLFKPGLLFLFLVVLVLVANRNHLRINQTVERDDKFFQNYIGTATQYNEFTPKWRQTTRVPIGFDPNVPIEVISGQATMSDVFAKSNEISFNIEVFSDMAQVRINKFYFPGWKVEVDGKRLTPFNDLTVSGPTNLRLDKEQDSSGLMSINLSGGNHQIVAKFSETPLRLFANYLTLGSLVLALGVIAKNVKK